MGSPTRRAAIVYPDSTDALEHAMYTPGGDVSESSSPQRSRNSSILNNNDSLLLNLFRDEVKEQPDFPEHLQSVLDSWPYKLTSSLLALFTIFGDDVRIVATNKNADLSFDIVFIAIFALFFLDIVLQSVARRRYLYSFTFWMDIIATLTILTDLSWIYNEIIDAGSDLPSSRIMKNVGSASRVASKSSQLIQIIRLVRLLRIMKMYNNSRRLLMVESPQQYRESRLETNRINFQRKMQILRNGNDLQKSSEHMNPRQSTGTPAAPRGLYTHNTFARLYQAKRVKSIKTADPEIELPNESRVSKVMTDLTIKQVFGIVFMAAVTFPFLDISVYHALPRSYSYGLLLLEDFRNSTEFHTLWDAYIDWHSDSTILTDIVSLHDEAHNITWSSSTSIGNLRDYDIMYVYSTHLNAVFNISPESRILGILDMSLILLMCLLMLVSAIKVIHDYSTTIIFGLERMITFVKKISRDPMLLLSPDHRNRLVPLAVTRRCCRNVEQVEYGIYEIRLLEQAIEKIGVMLALGFGTAGCEIITQNIKASGRLNPLIPGKLVLATFGFFSIMHFDKLAALLQEDLLLYVNKISKLLHCVCEKYQGAVNRNLGENFLVVWKYQIDDGVRTGKRLSVNTYSQSVRQRSAFALISSVKTLCKLVRSSEMLEYQQDSRITNILPFFTNKLTVGLHVGWAFEGPVGSGFKIDATYISPDVNMAARLETAAKQYGVNILVSESLFMRLDDEIQKYLRHIDTVVLKGSEIPIRIYSFDLHFAGLGVSKHVATKAQIDAKRLKVKEAFEFNYFQVHLLFTQSQKIERMREMYDEFFLEFYRRALESYLEGRWKEAAEIFRTRCLRQIPMDGPSRNLLAFMEAKGFLCPSTWNGVRVLGSK